MNFIPKSSAAEALEGLDEPSCILCLARCAIIMANEAGRQLWGIDSAAALPLALDAGMPGLVDLRGSEQQGPGQANLAAPVFWTARGILCQPCSMRPVTLSEGAALLLTWYRSENEKNVARRLSDGDERSHRSTAPPFRQPQHSDIAAMREIARRIRGKPVNLADGLEHTAAAKADALPMRASEEVNALASLSHELRTPLAAVIALAEIMTEEHLGPLPNERYRGYMRDIRDSARHALGLVDGMLKRDGLATGQPELVFAEVDLNETASSSVSAIRPLAERAGMVISTSLAERLPHVIADNRSLKQILLNLLSNSLKHAGRGAEIRVSSGYQLAGAAWIEVADTGSGIPAEILARAMRPDAKPPSQINGGLGLPLSRRLAQDNGARLDIDCATGQGTRARIVFAKDRTVPV